MTALAAVQFNPQSAMQLQVKRTASLDAAHAHILIFGKTKAGKTTTSVTLEREPAHNAIISTQPEEQLAHLKKLNIPYVCARNADELDKALRDPRQLFGQEMSTLIIDDFTEAVEFKRQQFELTIKDGRQVYKAVNNWAGDVLRKHMAGDYNLIATAFERGLTDEATMVQWITPDLPPSAADTVMSKFSFILHMEKDYKLLTQTDHARRVVAGNRFPKGYKLPSQVEPDLAALWDRFQAALRG